MNVNKGLNRIILVFCFLLSFYFMCVNLINRHHAMKCVDSGELVFSFFIAWIFTSFVLWVIKNIVMFVVLWIIIGFKDENKIIS